MLVVVLEPTGEAVELADGGRLTVAMAVVDGWWWGAVIVVDGGGGMVWDGGS